MHTMKQNILLGEKNYNIIRNKNDIDRHVALHGNSKENMTNWCTK